MEERELTKEPNSAITTILNPDTYLLMEGAQEYGGALVVSVANGISAVFDRLATIHNSRKTLAPNQLLTPEQKIEQLADASEKSRASAHTTMFNMLGDIDKRIEKLDSDLSKALLPAHHETNVEIRAHVKALDKNERVSFLTNAVMSNDQLTLRAVLSSPSYLSGLDNDQRDLFTRTYNEKTQPVLTGELKVAKKLREQAGNAHTLIDSEFEKAIGANIEKVKQIKSQSAQKAAALKAITG